MKNANYLKIGNERLDLLDDGIDIDSGLSLTIYNNGNTIEGLTELFSKLGNGITILGCIVQENGTETDEFKSSYHDETKMDTLTYDASNDTFTVRLIAPELS